MHSIEIYSIHGQKRYSNENSSTSEITLPNRIKEGYLVHVMMDANKVIKKLIIN